MEAVDKADSAQLLAATRSSTPTGWILLNFLMDPRTGLGRFRDFRISNYQLMMELIDACLDHDVEEILALPDVDERVDALPRARRRRRGADPGAARRVHDNLVVLDLRDEEVIHPTNRFMIYALLPAVQHLDPRAVGPQAAEHRVRDGQVDRRPLERHRRRRADARLRRRRPRGGRHLPGAPTTRPSACSASSSSASTPTVRRDSLRPSYAPPLGLRSRWSRTPVAKCTASRPKRCSRGHRMISPRGAPPPGP